MTVSIPTTPNTRLQGKRCLITAAGAGIGGELY